MTHDYKAALEEFKACLADEEDGSGYLWDAMNGKHGKAIESALQAMIERQAYISGLTEYTIPSKAPHPCKTSYGCMCGGACSGADPSQNVEHGE